MMWAWCEVRDLTGNVVWSDAPAPVPPAEFTKTVAPLLAVLADLTGEGE